MNTSIRTLTLAVVFLLSGSFINAGSAPAALINISNPANVLPGTGRTVTVSSTSGFAGVDNKDAMIDNLAASSAEDDSFIFGNGATNTLSITGFTSGFSVIRIFTAFESSRDAGTITVKSSTTSTTSLLDTSYDLRGTFIGPFLASTYGGSTSILHPYPVASPPSTSGGAGRGYYDLVLATPAPADTQSLFISFTNPTTNAQRVYEVQALDLPEPSSALAVVGGAFVAMTRGRGRRANQQA